MALSIPVNNNPYQLFDMQLTAEDAPISFFIWWNFHDKSWNLSLSDEDGPIFGMKRMTLNQYMMPNSAKFNGGDLIVLGTSDPRTINAFTTDNDLVWFTGEELRNALG